MTADTEGWRLGGAATEGVAPNAVGYTTICVTIISIQGDRTESK
jgi:hypothetical protein